MARYLNSLPVTYMGLLCRRYTGFRKGDFLGYGISPNAKALRTTPFKSRSFSSEIPDPSNSLNI